MNEHELLARIRDRHPDIVAEAERAADPLVTANEHIDRLFESWERLRPLLTHADDVPAATLVEACRVYRAANEMGYFHDVRLTLIRSDAARAGLAFR